LLDGAPQGVKRIVDAETMNIGAAELNGTNRDEV